MTTALFVHDFHVRSLAARTLVRGSLALLTSLICFGTCQAEEAPAKPAATPVKNPAKPQATVKKKTTKKKTV